MSHCDGSLSNVQLISKLLVVLSEALAEPKFAHVVARCMEGVADMPLEIGLAAHTPSLLFGQSLLAEHCALSTELLRVCRGTTISHPGVCPPLLILFCRARSFVLWLCFAHAAVSFVPNLDCKLRTERSFWREYFSASLRFGRRTFAALFRWHHKTLTLLLRPGVAQMVSLALHSLVWARLCAHAASGSYIACGHCMRVLAACQVGSDGVGLTVRVQVAVSLRMGDLENLKALGATVRLSSHLVSAVSE